MCCCCFCLCFNAFCYLFYYYILKSLSIDFLFVFISFLKLLYVFDNCSDVFCVCAKDSLRMLGLQGSLKALGLRAGYRQGHGRGLRAALQAAVLIPDFGPKGAAKRAKCKRLRLVVLGFTRSD